MSQGGGRCTSNPPADTRCLRKSRSLPGWTLTDNQWCCDGLSRRERHPPLHDLVLCDPPSCFGAFHGIATIRVRVFDKRETEGPSAVLVARKFSCTPISPFFLSVGAASNRIPIAVSAFSAVSNWTTPVPRDRPLGSYWISARSTLPIVVKSSTRSSLLVDHGN